MKAPVSFNHAFDHRVQLSYLLGFILSRESPGPCPAVVARLPAVYPDVSREVLMAVLKNTRPTPSRTAAHREERPHLTQCQTM